ncbi:phytoene/squalene synthase family protein [Mesorhizobium sp. BAC0120]|uniref:phytoene/squalene synthase family protein n=1 Tax=Mesorhizobium sp. BAC0120 TaxID=3090670 RepID=UPI00298C7968|nr:phytoene/squalene synthase family protein [Mesorhizobium sp. BAC0120]MDW6023953.1 phytoene/squalene synthase family protein [Mesorhizobium sp. BAC0120]
MESVRSADRDRYLSVLYAPQDKRAALFALYAFNVEIAAVRDRIREPLPGEIRLQWWRDAIANDEAQGHPLAEALLEAIRRYRLPRKTFEDYLEARVFDLYDDPMPDRNALEGYCGETASALIQLAALVLDPQAAARGADAAGHAGCTQAITGLLRLLPQHRARGQCFVPKDILAAAGTTPEEFVAGDGGPGAERAVAAMIALAREHLGAFQHGVRELPHSLRPAFLSAALSGAYLDRMEGPGSSPLRTVATLSEWRRHWLLFKDARRGW